MTDPCPLLVPIQNHEDFREIESKKCTTAVCKKKVVVFKFRPHKTGIDVGNSEICTLGAHKHGLSPHVTSSKSK